MRKKLANIRSVYSYTWILVYFTLLSYYLNFLVKHISNIWFYMLDVIIGWHTWNCHYARTYIRRYTHTHTRTHTQRAGEERGYCGGQHLILITLDRHAYFSVFHHLQEDKQRRQRHSLCEARYKRRDSFKRNYYIISPRVIIKATIIKAHRNELSTDAEEKLSNEYMQKKILHRNRKYWVMVHSRIKWRYTNEDTTWKKKTIRSHYN